MHTIVKAASAIQSLALATAFGGPVFAKAGMDSAVAKYIPDDKERGRFLANAWGEFEKVNIPVHLLFAATWLVARKALEERRLDKQTKKLVALNDVFIAGALATGVARALVGTAMMREFPSGVAVPGAASHAPAGAAKYRVFFAVSFPLTLACLAGSMVISPYIVAGIMRSRRRGLFARIFGK